MKIMFYVLDVAGSLLLTLLISLITWIISEFWRGVTFDVRALDRWTTEIASRGPHKGTYMFFYDWYNAGNVTAGTFFIWGLLSSIGISLIGLICSTILIIMRLVYVFDRWFVAIQPYVNLEKKPVIIAAVLLIMFLTPIYILIAAVWLVLNQIT